MMKKILCLILVLFFCYPGLVAVAEETRSVTEDNKGQEDEKVKELEVISAPTPVKDRFVIKYGGWFSSTLRKYKNTDNDNTNTDNLKTSWENDLRFWVWATYLRHYSVYLRFRNANTNRWTGTGYTGIGDDNEGPSLDMAYIVTDAELWEAKIGAKLGRQFLSIGRGISFSGVKDGIELNFRPKDFYIKTLFAHSNPQDYNLDLTVPEYDKKENRIYLGLETSYTRFYPVIFYIYGLTQRDLQDEHPDPGSSQMFKYHSHYLGLGFDKQAKKGASYWAEFIKEWGRDFMDTTYVSPQRSKIDAWAFDLGTRYIFEFPMRPSAEFEYAYGSGDSDRTDVVDTMPGGNRFGEDNNFSYYGYFATGYALAGRLSNLELIKLQVGFTPLEKIRFARDIDIGLKFFFYRKDRAEGPIYDTQATEASNDVGKEFNLFLYWEPNDNFYLNIRFGVFYPGDAYPDTTNSNTKYLLTRATFKF